MRWMLGALAVGCLVGCGERDEAPAAALKMEGYVWQSPDRAEVMAGAERAAAALDALRFRAAEMRWTGARLETEQVISDKLPVQGCGLVVRIGASAATLDWTSERRVEVAAVVARLAALGPREIQIDYDCPQSRLGLYRELLDDWRKAAGAVPLMPTALPSWLEGEGFAELARESPGYVLQVHSLQLPESPGEPVVLLDPEAARRAVAKAAALDVPFRVALPTYGCEVWFDDAGQVVEVVSEDEGPGFRPAGRSFAYADPAEAAALVAGWESEGLETLTGLVWYRIPVAGDRRNWRWETLEKVVSGEVPKAVVEVERASGGGVGDVVIVNRGDAPGRLPTSVLARGPVLAADAVGAYRPGPSKAGAEFVRRDEIWPWLEPGERTVIGWVTSSDGGAISWETR